MRCIESVTILNLNDVFGDQQQKCLLTFDPKLKTFT